MRTFFDVRVSQNQHSIQMLGESRLPYGARPSTILVDSAAISLLSGKSVGRQLRFFLRAHRSVLIAELTKLPQYVNTRYQDAGVARLRVTFRPDPESWHELRQFSRSFNVSICFVVSLLLELARRDVGTPSGIQVPPRLVRSLEIFATERFGLYSGKIRKSLTLRIPPEIVESPMYPFWIK